MEDTKEILDDIIKTEQEQSSNHENQPSLDREEEEEEEEEETFQNHVFDLLKKKNIEKRNDLINKELEKEYEKEHEFVAQMWLKHGQPMEYMLNEISKEKIDLINKEHEFVDQMRLKHGQPMVFMLNKIDKEKRIDLVKCDLCKKEIKGLRFKCGECRFYNLCSECNNNGKGTITHAKGNHVFVQLTRQCKKEFEDVNILKNSYSMIYTTDSSSYFLNFTSDIRCDQCGDEKIHNIRFKCGNCRWYNLCSKCNNNNGIGTLEHANGMHCFMQLCNQLPLGYENNDFINISVYDDNKCKI